MEIDYDYLCQNLGHLSSLQTRGFQNGERISSYCNVDFKPDLIELISDKIAACEKTIAYFDAVDSLFFGVLKNAENNITLVIGPTYRTNLKKERFSTILRALGEPQERMPELEDYLLSIPAYPLENFLQILCFVNYAINGEKLTIAELLARGIAFPQPVEPAQKKPIPANRDEVIQHNTYAVEKMIFSYVRSGQTESLRTFFSQPPTGRVGKMAHDELRQLKNTFICSATLASRAAIEGGLSQELTFSLSDLYIQKVEILGNYNDIVKLNMDMLIDFTNRVEELKCHGVKTRLTTSVLRCINEHLDKKLTTADIASALNMSRTHLCERFKFETGITINDFIIELKITEARRLLRATDKPIAQISDNLGFSSQSYFQNVFKKMIGMTPNAYRISASETDPNMKRTHLASAIELNPAI